MSDKTYEDVGSNIFTGAVIFSVFFLLVAVLASTGPKLTTETQATKAPTIETVVVTAPHVHKVS